MGANKTYVIPIFKINNTVITAVLPGGDLGNYTVRLNKLGFGYNPVPLAGAD